MSRRYPLAHILVPDFRICRNVLCRELDAHWVMQIVDFDAVIA
jgi:hypothetical protein